MTGLDRTEQCCGVCLPTLTWRSGILFIHPDGSLAAESSAPTRPNGRFRAGCAQPAGRGSPPAMARNNERLCRAAERRSEAGRSAFSGVLLSHPKPTLLRRPPPLREAVGLKGPEGVAEIAQIAADAVVPPISCLPPKSCSQTGSANCGNPCHGRCGHRRRSGNCANCPTSLGPRNAKPCHGDAVAQAHAAATLCRLVRRSAKPVAGIARIATTRVGGVTGRKWIVDVSTRERRVRESP
jgi:hypothetical protein